MDVLWETVSFVIKAFVVFITVAACAAVIFARMRGRRHEGHLEVRRLNDVIKTRALQLRGAISSPKEHKRAVKDLARASKLSLERNLFVLDFKGDIMASAAEDLREEVTALLGVAGEGDEVMVRIESAGGAVHGYGFAASQLDRIRKRGLKLTACIDRVAASGGYLMACVADHIVAAPFAVVGSIGVTAPVPNFHRLLERAGIEYEDITAGQYKRTVSPFAPISDQGRAKFKAQIEEVHQHFKDFVSRHQPGIDIEQIATGEHWLGERAAELGLVNELGTSDDYLQSRVDQANILEVSYQRPRSVRDRLQVGVHAAIDRLVDQIATRFGLAS
jgi:serine protease SohB